MTVGAFPEFPTNNLEKEAMPFRIHKNLRLSVEATCEEQDLRKADDKEIAAILRQFEQRGDEARIGAAASTSATTAKTCSTLIARMQTLSLHALLR